VILLVIPARGGSRRVPHKNIVPLRGKPLLLYTVEAALLANVTPHIVVSTDDQAIASIARGAGAGVIERPSELATDNASTESVLFHALDILAPEGITPDWIMTLPPTSPFRRPETIRRFADEVLAGPEIQDCLMSVTENRGDFWVEETNGLLSRLFSNAPRRQQDRAPLYEENSAIYMSRTNVLRETGSILGKRVRGLVISPLEGFDINTLDDLRLAECIAAITNRS